MAIGMVIEADGTMVAEGATRRQFGMIGRASLSVIRGAIVGG